MLLTWSLFSPEEGELGPPVPASAACTRTFLFPVGRRQTQQRKHARNDDKRLLSTVVTNQNLVRIRSDACVHKVGSASQSGGGKQKVTVSSCMFQRVTSAPSRTPKPCKTKTRCGGKKHKTRTMGNHKHQGDISRPAPRLFGTV